MTGPTPEPTTPNQSPSLQDQILNHVSSLETLIKQYNEKSGMLITPIRLTFGEEVDTNKGNDKENGGVWVDDDLKRQYNKVLESPFTRWIIEFSAPSHRMPTNLRVYDGSTDPDDHISRFVGAANQGEWEIPVWCRMFQQTLDGSARGWFDRMPNGSINSWSDLREKFVERFALRRRCSKDPTEVSKIVRKANESLSDFKERWTEEMGYIQGVPEVMQISAFMSNSKCPELARRFDDQSEKGHEVPYKGFLPPCAIQGGGPPRGEGYNAHNRRDHYMPYVPPRQMGRRYENRRFEHRMQEVNQLSIESLVKRPKEILATDLQLQLPPPSSQLEITLEFGKLNHLIKDVRQRGENRGRQGGNGSTHGKIINTVHEVGKNRKRKCRGRWEEDWMRSSGASHIRPLFPKLAPSHPGPPKPNSHRIVVEASPPYNFILGRTRMRELRAVSSTTHAMMNVPTPRRIATLVPRRDAIFECRQIEVRQASHEEPSEKKHRRKKKKARQKTHGWHSKTGQSACHECKSKRYPGSTKAKDAGPGKSKVVTKEVEEWLRAGIAVVDMQSPKMLKEMQSLSGKLAALNRFLFQSAERVMPFFDTLKNITKENKDDFSWTEAAEQAFQELKTVIMELPTLTTPNLKETLYVYQLLPEKQTGFDIHVGYRTGDTIPATESDEFIKFGVENLISIPSESEGIPEHMCDVPSHDTSPPLDVSKDQFEDLSESNKEFSSTGDDSFSFDKIDYVEASPPDSELVSSKVMEIVIPKVGGIELSNDNPILFYDPIISGTPPNLTQSGESDFFLEVDAFLVVEDEFTSSQFPKSYLDPEGDMLLFEAFLNDDHSSDFKTKSSSTSLNSLLEETNNFDNSLHEFTTFLKVLFDAECESDSGDDQSCSDEDVLEKIVSKPLYEFAGELTLLKSIPPEIDETDCDFEEDIHFIEKLLYDNSSPRPPEEFLSANSDAATESFSPSPILVKDSDSLMEEIDLLCTPDYPMPSGIKDKDYDFERDILIPKDLPSNN
nr:reverse transcriptase domain-containing protein [Tanacetum cinerariifolium]